MTHTLPKPASFARCAVDAAAAPCGAGVAERTLTTLAGPQWTQELPLFEPSANRFVARTVWHRSHVSGRAEHEGDALAHRTQAPPVVRPARAVHIHAGQTSARESERGRVDLDRPWRQPTPTLRHLRGVPRGPAGDVPSSCHTHSRQASESVFARSRPPSMTAPTPARWSSESVVLRQRP